jgi:hypothetical protein
MNTSNHVFEINKICLINVVDFIGNNSEHIINKISFNLHHDVQTCLLNNCPTTVSEFNNIVDNRFILNQHHLNKDKDYQFSYLMMATIKDILVELGLLKETYSVLMSSDGNIGIDITIDCPGAGEDKLKRVTEHFDRDNLCFKNHTLIFNYSLNVS